MELNDYEADQALLSELMESLGYYSYNRTLETYNNDSLDQVIVQLHIDLMSIFERMQRRRDYEKTPDWSEYMLLEPKPASLESDAREADLARSTYFVTSKL